MTNYLLSTVLWVAFIVACFGVHGLPKPSFKFDPYIDEIVDKISINTSGLNGFLDGSWDELGKYRDVKLYDTSAPQFFKRLARSSIGTSGTKKVGDENLIKISKAAVACDNGFKMAAKMSFVKDGKKYEADARIKYVGPFDSWIVLQMMDIDLRLDTNRITINQFNFKLDSNLFSLSLKCKDPDAQELCEEVQKPWAFYSFGMADKLIKRFKILAENLTYEFDDIVPE